MIILLAINFNICLGCSKEPSNRDGSLELPQDMFLLRNKKNIFSITMGVNQLQKESIDFVPSTHPGIHRLFLEPVSMITTRGYAHLFVGLTGWVEMLR